MNSKLILRAQKFPLRKLSVLLFIVLVLSIGLLLSIQNNNVGDLFRYFTKDRNEISKLNPESVRLPVSLNNKNVNNVYLTYNFFGQLREIKNQDSNPQVILDPSEPGLPDFLIDPETQFYNVDSNDKILPGTIDDLKVGTRLSISATYELKDESWKTRMIYIVNN